MHAFEQLLLLKLLVGCYLSTGLYWIVFTIRYDTIEEFNVDSKAEYSA